MDRIYFTYLALRRMLTAVSTALSFANIKACSKLIRTRFTLRDALAFSRFSSYDSALLPGEMTNPGRHTGANFAKDAFLTTLEDTQDP